MLRFFAKKAAISIQKKNAHVVFFQRLYLTIEKIGYIVKV